MGIGEIQHKGLLYTCSQGLGGMQHIAHLICKLLSQHSHIYYNILVKQTFQC